ncbi:MAG: DNA polymerase III subunit gamma/tau [Clostridiaceae bacterium]|nr:DNA polymerase III subunit gamma/tau [Clostridiaceae bacterium]
MLYQALYRKWRPQVFEDVVGQEHITQTLKNQVIAQKTAHAYLFCGTRGTGKTSVAKILSRAVNCPHSNNGNPCNKCDICRGIMDGSILDVVEIDAASNNGVDNVREIRDEVVYSPARTRRKVYIIDEVHMLSTGAFNALLKTLEEPPAHVMFILATTESHKIPATILSRCQRFDFKRITSEDIVERLKQIAVQDEIKVEEEGLKLIARVADGSMRDALSILDQCMSFGKGTIRYEDIASILGVVDNEILFDTAQSVFEQDSNAVIEIIDKLIMDGKDILQFLEGLIEHFRNLLLCKVLKNPEHILDAPKETISRLKKQSNGYTQEKIVYCIETLTEVSASVKWSSTPRILLEVALIKLCRPNLDMSVESLLNRIADLENRLSAGTIKVETAKKMPDNIELQPGKKNSISEKRAVNVNKRLAPPDEGVKKAIDSWAEIMEEIKKMGKPILYANLLDVRVVPIENVLGIVFKDTSATSKLWVSSRSDNMETLEQVVHKVAGIPVKIKCFLEKELVQAQDENHDDKLEQLIQLKDQLGDKMQIYDE